MPLKRLIEKSLYPIFWEKNRKEHPLRWVELELTERCPLSCLHCGSDCASVKEKHAGLDLKTLYGVMQRVASAYDPKGVNVALTGGEPFFRKDFFHIAAMITEMGFGASVVTSGYLMNEEMLLPLKASGINSLSISIDGMEASHNWLRGKPDAFEKAIRSVRMLVESGLFYVEVITTLNRKNVHELNEMAALFQNLGIHAWRMGKVFPRGRAQLHPELFLTPEEFRFAMEYILDWRNRNDRPFGLTYFEEGCLGKKYDFKVRDGGMQCSAGVNILTILSDGSVTGCAAADRRFVQGNILKDDPVELWEKEFKVFRNRDWMRRGKCGSCHEWERCHGDGFHLWEMGSKDAAYCAFEELKHAGFSD